MNWDHEGEDPFGLMWIHLIFSLFCSFSGYYEQKNTAQSFYPHPAVHKARFVSPPRRQIPHTSSPPSAAGGGGAIGGDSSLIFDCYLSHDLGTDELGRRTHDRVAAIHRGLSLRGLHCCLDSSTMTGNVLEQVSSSISGCKVVLVFITKSYVDKVESSSFNICQLEFNTALRQKSSALVAVVLEPRMNDPSRLRGLVGTFFSAWSIYTRQLSSRLKDSFCLLRC